MAAADNRQLLVTGGISAAYGGFSQFNRAELHFLPGLVDIGVAVFGGYMAHSAGRIHRPMLGQSLYCSAMTMIGWSITRG